MGILDRLGLKRTQALSSPVAILSPWAEPANLGGVIVSEATGLDLSKGPMDRATALSVPAVARGRHLIVSAIASLPPAVYKDGSTAPETQQPKWLHRTDTAVTPAERIARTVDSLIFHGRALWAIKRVTGHGIVDAAWVPDDQWQVTQDGIIQVKDGDKFVDVDEDEIILFNGYTEGLLMTAARTLRNAIAIENTRVSRARNPIPLTVIRHDPSASGNNSRPELYDGTDADGEKDEDIPDEVGNLLESWSKARRSEDGALGYLPPGLIIDTHTGPSDDGIVALANALRVDIASHLGIPASLLDGAVAQSTLTYETTEGNTSRFWTETLPLYISPIENALSLAIRGADTTVRFGKPEYITNPGAPMGAPDPTPSEETAA